MLVDAIAETDDEIMMKYLEGEEISIDELKAALRKAVCENKLFPVLCGSSYKNKGVQMLLDAVIDYMPSPLDIPAIKGVNLIQALKKLALHPMKNHSPHWPSKSWLTLMLVN